PAAGRLCERPEPVPLVRPQNRAQGSPGDDTLRLCRRAALRRRRHRCGPAGGPLRLVVDPGVCAPVAARLYLRPGPTCDHATGVTCRPVRARNATTVCPPAPATCSAGHGAEGRAVASPMALI